MRSRKMFWNIIKAEHSHPVFWGPMPSSYSSWFFAKYYGRQSPVFCKGEGQISALETVYYVCLIYSELCRPRHEASISCRVEFSFKGVYSLDIQGEDLTVRLLWSQNFVTGLPGLYYDGACTPMSSVWLHLVSLVFKDIVVLVDFFFCCFFFMRNEFSL